MPYSASESHGKTRKANTGSRSRQWIAVYESSRARGDDEGTAYAKASGVVKKNWKKTNPKRRKPVDHRPEYMKAAHEGFLKAAGLKRVRRVTRAALISRTVVAPAADKAVRKHERRIARWGLKNFGKVGPEVRGAYQAHADAANVVVRAR